MNARYIAGLVCLAIAIAVVLLLVNLFDRSGLEVRSHPPRDAVVAAGELARDDAVGEYLHADFVTDQFLEDLHLRRVEEERQERLRAEAARKAAARKLESARANPSSTPTRTTSPATGRCGGDLPPCWVMQRESGGSITAVNPTGCGGRGCYGKWQFDPRTWASFGGYSNAHLAPESVQDDKARQLWAGGRGCSHWAAC